MMNKLNFNHESNKLKFYHVVQWIQILVKAETTNLYLREEEQMEYTAGLWVS